MKVFQLEINVQHIFPLFLNILKGSKYWIPDVYAHKLWHITDRAEANFLESF